MNRYLFNQKTKVMARVMPNGTVTFHNETGFQVKDPIDIMTQEATVMMLKEQGYVEKAV